MLVPVPCHCVKYHCYSACGNDYVTIVLACNIELPVAERMKGHYNCQYPGITVVIPLLNKFP